MLRYVPCLGFVIEVRVVTRSRERERGDAFLRYLLKILFLGQNRTFVSNLKLAWFVFGLILFSVPDDGFGGVV